MSEEEKQQDLRLYEILNVSKTATESEIRESHRRLSRLFHPDKHSSTSIRDKADPRFQEIQYAFEILSDPRRRTIYDTLGEEGLGIKLEVGQRNMTPDELRAFFLSQARQARVEELDALVQTRGDTAISMDARSMFGGRVVIEKHLRVGSPIPMTITRPATLQERFTDLTFRGLNLRNSFSIPFSFSNLFDMKEAEKAQNQSPDKTSALTITGTAAINGKRQLGSFGLLAALRHQMSPKTTLETSMPLVAPRVLRAKVTHQYSPDQFVVMDVAASTWACPPDVTLTSGRQITDRGVLFATLRSGPVWKLAGWGRPGNAASYILGWTRNALPSDPTGYTLELITGLQVLGLAAEYNTAFKPSGIKLKIGGSATTSGMAMNIGATRKITANATIGANITANSQSLIVRLSCSRLGQNFRIPIWIGDGLELDSILYGVLLPLGGLIIYEYAVVQPRQRKRKSARLLRKKEHAKELLEERENSARESVEVMSDAITRKQQSAKTQGGLYIHNATYGTESQRIDVTIALAAQINENQLVLSRNLRKSNMLGFWDPAFGEKKTLRVEYLFGNQRHHVEIDDKDGLALPSHSHIS